MAVLVGGGSLIAAIAAAGAYEPVGADFRISNIGTDGDADRDGFNPAVAYNATANEYLVTWLADGFATADEFEVFGQRVSAAGAELGADFRISNVGTDGDAARTPSNPAVAYSATANEYLVTWSGDGLATNDEDEVFGQRVSAAGAELGTDFRISNVGTDLDAARDASDPAVAYNATANEYLVTCPAPGWPRPTRTRSSDSASAPRGPSWGRTSGSPTSAPTATPTATAPAPRSPTARPRTSTWSPGRRRARHRQRGRGLRPAAQRRGGRAGGGLPDLHRRHRRRRRPRRLQPRGRLQRDRERVPGHLEGRRARHRQRVRGLRPAGERRGGRAGCGLPDLQRRRRRRRRPRGLQPRGRLQPDRERVPGHLVWRRARHRRRGRGLRPAVSAAGASSARTFGSPTSAPTATPTAGAEAPRSPTAKPRTSTWSPGRPTGSPWTTSMRSSGADSPRR